MTPYLDQLDRELADAAGRIVAGKRHRPLAPTLAFVAAAVACLILVLATNGPEDEQAVEPAPPAGRPFVLAGPPPELEDVRVNLTATEPGGAITIALELRAAGWNVRMPRRSVMVSHPVEGLLLTYGTASRADAEVAARTLGVEEVAPATGGRRNAPLTLVVGERPAFAGAVDAYRAGFSALERDGTAKVQTGLGPVGLSVRGGSLCLSSAGGGGCGGYDFSVSGRMVVTSKRGSAVTRVIGLVPDGIRYVTIAGNRVPVTDNVWAHGPTDSGHVDIPGRGRVAL